MQNCASSWSMFNMQQPCQVTWMHTHDSEHWLSFRRNEYGGREWRGVTEAPTQSLSHIFSFYSLHFHYLYPVQPLFSDLCFFLPLILQSAPLYSSLKLWYISSPFRLLRPILPGPCLSFGGSWVPVWSFICIIYIHFDRLLYPSTSSLLTLGFTASRTRKRAFSLWWKKEWRVTDWTAIQRNLIVKKEKKLKTGLFVVS